jgi:hypothetical protein
VVCGKIHLARSMQRFRRMRSLKMFVSATNHFCADRDLTFRAVFDKNRDAALARWDQLGGA